MSIKLTLESPVATLEQFDEILHSYKTQNAICGVCSPIYYEAGGIVEKMRDYFTFEHNIGISRIRFHWEEVFTNYKLEYPDFCNTIDSVSRFFSEQSVIYGLFRKDNDLVIEFFIHPKHIKGFTVTPATHEMMQYLTRCFNAYTEMSDEVVYFDGCNEFVY